MRMSKSPATQGVEETSTSTNHPVHAYAATLKGEGKTAPSIPAARLRWTPGFAVACLAVFLIVNLLLIVAFRPEWLERQLLDEATVVFEPSQLGTPPSHGIAGLPSRDGLMEFPATELLGTLPGRRVIVITEDDRENLLQQLRGGAPNLSPPKTAQDDDYETYINPDVQPPSMERPAPTTQDE